jgi:hypothetical protein
METTVKILIAGLIAVAYILIGKVKNPASVLWVFASSLGMCFLLRWLFDEEYVHSLEVFSDNHFSNNGSEIGSPLRIISFIWTAVLTPVLKAGIPIWLWSKTIPET